MPRTDRKKLLNNTFVVFKSNRDMSDEDIWTQLNALYHVAYQMGFRQAKKLLSLKDILLPMGDGK